MKVLFIGGSGIISSACTPLAVEKGYDVTLFNRGQSFREIPKGVRVLHGDIRDKEAATQVLGEETFDVVVDWIAFTPDHIETDLALFQNRTKQYIFISSASAYQTPPANLPITESTPLSNPVWEYSRNKIACEERLMKAYREEDFPMTVVRPSHTYDKTLLPMNGGYTIVDRMRRGQKVIVYGDGTSLWTLTHHSDFAKGLVGLLGNNHAIGDTFHITSDEVLTWNQICHEMARAAGTTANIVHISSDLIGQYIPSWRDGLLGDKVHSMIFDNTKIKRLVPDFSCTTPFARGIDEIMAWYDADPARQKVDDALNDQIDRLISAYESIFM